MALFGTDPKDGIIEILNGIIEDLRAENAELRKQNMAFTDKAAFSITYPRANTPIVMKPLEPQGADLRSVPFKPSLTRDQIEDSFKKRA